MKKGDRVVCLDASNGYVDGFKGLVKGKIYKITCTLPSTEYNPMNVGVNGIDGTWHCTRFRKVITDHTFTNELTEELANKPLIKEGLEKVKEKQTIEASNNSRMAEAKLSIELYKLDILCQD